MRQDFSRGIASILFQGKRNSLLLLLDKVACETLLVMTEVKEVLSTSDLSVPTVSKSPIPFTNAAVEALVALDVPHKS